MQSQDDPRKCIQFSPIRELKELASELQLKKASEANRKGA